MSAACRLGAASSAWRDEVALQALCLACRPSASSGETPRPPEWLLSLSASMLDAAAAAQEAARQLLLEQPQDQVGLTLGFQV